VCMKSIVALVLLVRLGTVPAAGQRPETTPATGPPAAVSPNKLLKAQHEEVKKLTARLATLSAEVEEEIEKGGENILPLSTLKKLEEIEKLARKIRGRIKQ